MAFIFIPTSTICSFFGMNIKELDEHPRLWAFFANLIAVVIVVLIIGTADGLLSLILRILAAMPVVPRGGEEPISPERKLIVLILVMVVKTPLSFIWKACATISRKVEVYVRGARILYRLRQSKQIRRKSKCN
jgi:biotin transporter BioY